MSGKETVVLTGDVPSGRMLMFKDSSMKYVACLVRRFLELSPDHSMNDFNNVRVFQHECFISLLEDINILRARPIEIRIQSSYVSSFPNQRFGNKNYDLVYDLINQSTEYVGIDMDSVFSIAKWKMPENEVEKALNFLSSEGHIYSTIDEHHFKTTNGD